MAGNKKQRLPLQSNSTPERSICLSSKTYPIPLSQTPPTTTSPTDTTTTSMELVGAQPIPALSLVSGLEDNDDPPQSPTPGLRRLPKYKIPEGYFLLFGKLHPKNPKPQVPLLAPMDTTATSIGLVADQPIPAASAVNGPQDTTNVPQPLASGPSVPMRPGRNGTALDPNSIGISEKKGLKLWESNLWFPRVHIPGRSKKGIQIFLGNYHTKQEAQDVHDRAALKLLETKGVVPKLNFPASRHAEFMEEYKDWNFRDLVWQFRRYSVRFTTGQSCMKGVAVTETDEGNLFEAKTSYTYSPEVKEYYYLGKFESEEEAGRAYDRAVLFLHQGKTEEEKLNVITNFRPSKYSTSEILSAGEANEIKIPDGPSRIA